MSLIGRGMKMTQKGIQTKNEILETAKKLFMQKGYIAVTMSDLCDATGLSRGGLYRHFSSTNDVFVALLTSDKDNWEDETQKAIDAGFSAIKMLSYYFEQVIIGISEGEGRLSLAVYEYERSEQDKKGFLSKRYTYAVDMMERILQYGQARGELIDFDTHTEAEHLVIFIDGLKMASAAIPLPAKTIRLQLDNLICSLERKD